MAGAPVWMGGLSGADLRRPHTYDFAPPRPVTRRALAHLCPKVELHNHLDGAIRPDMIRKYAQKHRATFEGYLADQQDPEKKDKLPFLMQTPRLAEMVAAAHKDDGGRELRHLMTCPSNSMSLADFLKPFSVILPVLAVHGSDAMREAAEVFVFDQAKQNVVYSEARYAPSAVSLGPEFEQTVLDRVTEGLADGQRALRGDVELDLLTLDLPNDGALVARARAERAQAAFFRAPVAPQVADTTVHQLICLLDYVPFLARQTMLYCDCRVRNSSRAAELSAPQQADLAEAPIVGLDVAAGENHYTDDKIHAQILEALNVSGNIKSTNRAIHAAEDGTTSPVNVDLALAGYGASRIGHGYQFAKDVLWDGERRTTAIKRENPDFRDCPQYSASSAARELAANRELHFEVCPQSSIKTGAIREGWENHVARDMRAANWSVSLNSDDPTVINTNCEYEVWVAMDKLGFAPADIERATHDALDFAFCDESVRSRVRAIVDRWWKHHVVVE